MKFDTLQSLENYILCLNSRINYIELKNRLQLINIQSLPKSSDVLFLNCKSHD